jgi:hypothetical protein
MSIFIYPLNFCITHRIYVTLKKKKKERERERERERETKNQFLPLIEILHTRILPKDLH